MDWILKFWPLIVGAIIAITGYAALRTHVRAHSIDLERLSKALAEHLSDPRIHYGDTDRETAHEWRLEQSARSERIEAAVIELSRELMRREHK